MGPRARAAADTLGQWPYLLGATICFTFAVIIHLEADDPDGKQAAATTLVIIGSALIGAFLASRPEPSRPPQPRDSEGSDEW